MTEESSNEKEEQEVSLQAQLAERDSMITELKSQFEAVKRKSDELLTEAKQAKNKAREAASSREQAKLDKAKKDGDFEQLLKSSENERTTLKQELDNLRNNVSVEKINNHSMKVAAELADGANAELLAEFISKRMKFVDNDIKVLDSTGNLTVSSLEDLKNEFQSNDKFKSLLRGTKSSGGGAPGSSASSASEKANKTIDRPTFDTMSQFDRAAFFKDGGKIVDSTQ